MKKRETKVKINVAKKIINLKGKILKKYYDYFLESGEKAVETSITADIINDSLLVIPLKCQSSKEYKLNELEDDIASLERTRNLVKDYKDKCDNIEKCSKLSLSSTCDICMCFDGQVINNLVAFTNINTGDLILYNKSIYRKNGKTIYSAKNIITGASLITALRENGVSYRTKDIEDGKVLFSVVIFNDDVKIENLKNEKEKYSLQDNVIKDLLQELIKESI